MSDVQRGVQQELYENENENDVQQELYENVWPAKGVSRCKVSRLACMTPGGYIICLHENFFNADLYT